MRKLEEGVSTRDAGARRARRISCRHTISRTLCPISLLMMTFWRRAVQAWPSESLHSTAHRTIELPSPLHLAQWDMESLRQSAHVLGSGRRRTICIDGDGGLQINVQELETIRRLNLPIKLLVLSNNGYASIRVSQKRWFGRPGRCGPLKWCQRSAATESLRLPMAFPTFASTASRNWSHS